MLAPLSVKSLLSESLKLLALSRNVKPPLFQLRLLLAHLTILFSMHNNIAKVDTVIIPN